MGSSVEFRKAFVERLVQACDDSKDIPPPHQGRQQKIATALKVAPEAVSKWFKAVAMPMPAKMQLLADLLQVDASWLAYGMVAEFDRTERRALAREVDGAVHLVLGMVMLAGGTCGMPAKTDSRSGYVDFYVTTRGQVFPVHVTLGTETAPGTYEVIVPKEYTDVHCIAVMPVGGGKYHFVDLRRDLIDSHKTRKSGAFAVAISRGDGQKYVTDGDVWPQVKTFIELG